MSKPEVVKEKQVDDKIGSHGDGKLSIQEELTERREAIEKGRKEREQSREDFMLGKGGKASDHFEIVDNRETVERYVDQTGAPETTENLSESAREKWLRTGELPEKKADGKAAEKKEEQAAKSPERPKMADYRDGEGHIKTEEYEQALDRYEQDKTEFAKQQAAAPKIDAQLDKEIFEEIGKRRDWWNEPEHAEAHQTLPKRIEEARAALSADDQKIIATSPAMTMPIHGELQGFLGHALARVKNLGHVYLELSKDPGMLQRMNQDWTKSANNHKDRWATEQSIRYVLRVIDKKGGSAGANGAGRKEVRKLTQAGSRLPLEASGGGSSPADDGSAEAAWKRKDLSQEARGELYRERKNKEDADKRRRRVRR